MRILLVHNFYGSSAPSGENVVFEAERSLLNSRGHDVREFTRHSDEIRTKGKIGILQGALATPWNPIASKSLKKIVDAFRPDVMHVHNTFPLISPSIFHAAAGRVPSVLTLHNYRILCPAAIPMRAGRVCTECLDTRSVLPALKYGCYRGSRLATLPLALNVTLHRALGTWTNQVSTFIAFTEFQRERMVNAGLPRARIFVKPNFYPGVPAQIDWDRREDYVVFAGRLSPEKGIETLVRAWILWGEQAPELRIMGDGPLRVRLEQMTASVPDARIRFLGQVASEHAEKHIANAKLLVLPSEWFEGFPMVIREAFAFGTPAAVSDIGPLPSIVKDGVSGVVFPAGDAQTLMLTVRETWEKTGMLERLSVGARAAFEANYTEEANYQLLMQAYEKAAFIWRQRK